MSVYVGVHTTFKRSHIQTHAHRLLAKYDLYAYTQRCLHTHTHNTIGQLFWPKTTSRKRPSWKSANRTKRAQSRALVRQSMPKCMCVCVCVNLCVCEGEREKERERERERERMCLWAAGVTVTVCMCMCTCARVYIYIYIYIYAYMCT